MGPAPILAFAVSVAYWPGLISAAVAPRWALLAVALPLLFWLDPRRLVTGSWVSLIIVIAMSDAALLCCPDRLIGFDALIHLLIFVAAVLAGGSLLSIDGAYTGAALGLCISAVLVIPQAFGWEGINQAMPPAGLFFNRDVLAEPAALVVIWAILSRRWILVGLLAIPLVLCGSRVAICTVAAGLAVGLPGRLRLYGIGALAVFGFLVFSVQPGKLHSFANRLELWQNALGDLRFFGHGIGAFTAEHRTWEYAHSDLFQAVYELGVVGAVALAALFVLAWINGRDRIARSVLAGAIVQVLVAFPLHLPLQTLLVGLLAGSMARRRDLVRRPGSHGGVASGTTGWSFLGAWRALAARAGSRRHVPV